LPALADLEVRRHGGSESRGDPPVTVECRMAVVPHEVPADDAVGGRGREDCGCVHHRNLVRGTDLLHDAVLFRSIPIRTAVAIDGALIEGAGAVDLAESAAAIAGTLASEREARLEVERGVEMRQGAAWIAGMQRRLSRVERRPHRRGIQRVLEHGAMGFPVGRIDRHRRHDRLDVRSAQ